MPEPKMPPQNQDMATMPGLFPPRRGELRILLGAAPGVGKTYAMLREGQRLAEQGHDVVVGYLEAHGRKETAEQAERLEILPRRQMLYRDTAMEEMDLNGVLQRRPEIVLVDELAHSNVPGSLHRKRWQDIEDIRDAGIDVISTMNVQHINELADIVTGIVGVPVRETVPDRILDSATEIQLVDLPIDILLERLQQGKVYSADRSRQALDHFFRRGTLNALRELALRRTATGVDDRLDSMMLEGNAGSAIVADRVMVLLDPDPEWGAVLRAAWRLATAVQSEVDILVLAPHGVIGDLPEADRAKVEAHTQTGLDLGAQVTVIDDRGGGQEGLAALVDELRARRIFIFVIGVKVVPAKWGRAERLTGMDRVSAVMLALPLIGVYVVRM